MTAPDPGETPERTWSPRLAALALLVAGVATVGLALHPGPALAAGDGSCVADLAAPTVGIAAGPSGGPTTTQRSTTTGRR